MTTEKRIIIGVAIKQGDTIHSLPKPNRHSDVIEKAIADGHYIGERVEGFICNDGSFLNRTDAGKLALQTGQIRSLRSPSKLSSDDLW